MPKIMCTDNIDFLVLERIWRYFEFAILEKKVRDNKSAVLITSDNTKVSI